ncbi:hypothetical protein SDC9_181425 [bioreactor metagenome]|uniref:Uncharacterized protein n=1 Tax=bioreactor metagenome TaxID=1076179 RepID=A0A645HDT0_9ZZZZ
MPLKIGITLCNPVFIFNLANTGIFTLIFFIGDINDIDFLRDQRQGFCSKLAEFGVNQQYLAFGVFQHEGNCFGIQTGI